MTTRNAEYFQELYHKHELHSSLYSFADCSFDLPFALEAIYI